MEEVNALTIRNKLGEVLDRLNKKGEPILISKGRKVRAVLVTPEQFERRFLDWQAREEKKKILDGMKRLRKNRRGGLDSLSILRQLRGYEK
jgi:prevent-host-death family protein